jgi:hypothetical protein
MGLNWLSSASNVTDYWLIEQGSIPNRSRTTTSRPVPGPTQPPIQWVSCVTVADCDTDRSSASSSNVTNAWSCTLITPVCAFVTYAQRQLYHNISSVYSCKLSSSCQGCETISELRPPTGILLIPQMICEYRVSWWNDIDRGIPKNSERNLSQCQFVHHKSHMDWCPQWEFGD